MSEPIIVINGVTLTEGQAMALRVAANQFTADLRDKDHMASLGVIGPTYLERMSEIIRIMHRR